ncbi:TetR/AcrR family transcriptional regulator [Glaciimonas sp. PAMC28666]|uniref:acrylate utilization transcriptional regulator AcuR n=1 Tax=Glaciimonas sp. PAMC28666 TaxID=2807626 RepID=UPI001963BA72|nr:TetR/AcrR family transcriptional regulator [Glaciimonas sp. PAMC28666]QRX80839.1 TetR/AcrR family transcriptional regulator [Glaciimonas sp. PAMC28666]
MAKTTVAPAPRDKGKRAELIRIGVAIFTEKGFHNTPLDEVVKAAGVPKGSFYYYFENKETYTLAVIDSYADYFAGKLDRILLDPSLPPLERIKAFTADASGGMKRFDYKRGCLIGNLGQELAALDDKFRIALLNVLTNWRERIQACLDEAKVTGDLRADVNTEALARYFWIAWEGAVLCSKLEKSRVPLDDASNAFMEHLKHLQPR